ncbi:uncharacterized protein JCM6883_002278 [Sporobolomyces salmoneus]|uniref:uncharacterized protein n=1 Tax=Sporobolomyces salmoneus TaxID=183962 RepID=UPI00316D2A89
MLRIDQTSPICELDRAQQLLDSLLPSIPLRIAAARVLQEATAFDSTDVSVIQHAFNRIPAILEEEGIAVAENAVDAMELGKSSRIVAGPIGEGASKVHFEGEGFHVLQLLKKWEEQRVRYGGSTYSMKLLNSLEEFQEVHYPLLPINENSSSQAILTQEIKSWVKVRGGMRLLVAEFGEAWDNSKKRFLNSNSAGQTEFFTRVSVEWSGNASFDAWLANATAPHDDPTFAAQLGRPIAPPFLSAPPPLPLTFGPLDDLPRATLDRIGELAVLDYLHHPEPLSYDRMRHIIAFQGHKPDFSDAGIARNPLLQFFEETSDPIDEIAFELLSQQTLYQAPEPVEALVEYDPHSEYEICMRDAEYYLATASEFAREEVKKVTLAKFEELSEARNTLISCSNPACKANLHYPAKMGPAPEVYHSIYDQTKSAAEKGKNPLCLHDAIWAAICFYSNLTEEEFYQCLLFPPDSSHSDLVGAAEWFIRCPGGCKPRILGVKLRCGVEGEKTSL